MLLWRIAEANNWNFFPSELKRKLTYDELLTFLAFQRLREEERKRNKPKPPSVTRR